MKHCFFSFYSSRFEIHFRVLTVARSTRGIAEVASVAAELARLKEEGFRAIDEAPRPGFGGTRIAFLHPQSALGVLWELVEVPKV